jgi:hypothetical protein
MARAIYITVSRARYIANVSHDGDLLSLHLPGDYVEVPMDRLTEKQRSAARDRARFAWRLRQPAPTT